MNSLFNDWNNLSGGTRPLHFCNAQIFLELLIDGQYTSLTRSAKTSDEFRL